VTVYVQQADGSFQPIGHVSPDDIWPEPDPTDEKIDLTTTRTIKVTFTLQDYNPRHLELIYGFDILLLTRTIKDWLSNAIATLPLPAIDAYVRRPLPPLQAGCRHPYCGARAAVSDGYGYRPARPQLS